MRLLMCIECKTLEELPDFNGRPEDDVLLEELISRHQFTEGYPHHGNLISIEDDKWADTVWREATIRQLWSDAGYTGMEPEFYASKNTFQEEAAKCYAAHRRPKDGCIDYKDRSKRIGNSLLDDDDKRVRAEHGLKRRQTVYLCDFCPAKFHYVQQKAYAQAGLYE